MPSTATPRSLSLGGIGGLLLILGAVVAARPSAADVSFDIEAAGFDVPVPLRLALYRGSQFELKEFTANGFNGTLAFHTDADIRAGAIRHLPANAKVIGLSSGEVQPFLSVSREGGVKEITLDLRPPANLEGLGMDTLPGIKITSVGKDDAKLVVDSAVIKIEKSAYYVVPQISPMSLPAFSGVFQGNPQSTDRTARLDLTSSQSANTSAQLYFANLGGAMRLAGSVEMPPRDATLSFRDVSYASILIYDEAAGEASLSRPAPVSMRIRKGTIETLELVPPGVDKIARLRIKGTAQASSVRERGKELRPTALADLMRDPWAGRNLRLMGCCVLVLVGLKVISHVGDLLLKRRIGD